MSGAYRGRNPSGEYVAKSEPSEPEKSNLTASKRMTRMTGLILELAAKKKDKFSLVDGPSLLT